MSSLSLTSYISKRLSLGYVALIGQEATKELKISYGAFLDAAERLQHKGRLVRLRHNFYVIVPSQYLAFGSTPVTWYINEFMAYTGLPYYVSLLKAAQMYGASHHAVMEFQVVTNKQLPNIEVGRARIAFYYRKEMDLIAHAIKGHKSDTGTIKIASVELTIFDLLRYSHASGGIDNIVTVISDLASQAKAEKLANLSRAFEHSISQRVGYLLDCLGYTRLTAALHKDFSKKKAIRWIELNPNLVKGSLFSSDIIEKNRRWKVIVRQKLEVEEK